MKTQQADLLMPLSKQQIQNLTREVKEVLATGFSKSKQPVFGETELWNIRRQARPRIQRRFL